MTHAGEQYQIESGRSGNSEREEALFTSMKIKQVTIIIIIPLFLIFEFVTKQKVKMTASLLLKGKHLIYTI